MDGANEGATRTGKATWGVVATIKETPEATKQFVAHYKSIGASEIHVFFDDPDDPAADLVEAVPGVHVTRCDRAHWGGAPSKKIEPRQKHNANLAYALTGCDWLMHLDADELLWSPGDIADALGALGSEVPVARVPPAEMMETRRKDGLFIFRRPMPRNRRGRRIGEEVWGELYPILERGLLGHSIGKCFVRSGQEAVQLTNHIPYSATGRLFGEPLPGVELLHLHGGDADDWVRAFRFRMEIGAYRAALNDDRKRSGKIDGMGRNAWLSKLYEEEGEAGLRRFHARVARFGPDKRALRRARAILKVRLWLPQKVETWFPGSFDVPTDSIGWNPETSRLEARVEAMGSSMIVVPDDNYTETCLASGRPYEAEELAAIEGMVRDRKVLFLDVGGNAGVYSLLVARHAAQGSAIHAFEPSPEMAFRFRRNVALNGYENITLHELALGPGTGQAHLTRAATHGQATTRDVGGEGMTVEMRALAEFVADTASFDLMVLKIDIEGAEAECLAPFFRDTPPEHWPDAILYEHSHTDDWSAPPDAVFPSGAYHVARTFDENTLLVRTGRDVPLGPNTSEEGD